MFWTAKHRRSAFIDDVKTRIVERDFRNEMQTLEKAQKSELRMLEWEKRMTQRKYFRRRSSNSSKDSELKLTREIGTLSPLIYKPAAKGKSGDCSSSDLTTQMVEEMILTDGELDIEKVICLHLMAAHNFFGDRYIKSPFRGSNHGKLWPWRILVRCSSSYVTNEDLFKAICSRELPTYVLTVNPYWKTGSSTYTITSPCSTGRESSRSIFVSDAWSRVEDDVADDIDEVVTLFVNTVIEQIVDVVTKSLAEVNPKKLEAMKLLARNPGKLKKLLTTEKIDKFFEALSSQPCLWKQDFFVMVPTWLAYRASDSPLRREDHDAKAVNLEVPANVTTPSLEKLIKEIRTSVAQEAEIFYDKLFAHMPDRCRTGACQGSFEAVAHRDSDMVVRHMCCSKTTLFQPQRKSMKASSPAARVNRRVWSVRKQEGVEVSGGGSVGKVSRKTRSNVTRATSFMSSGSEVSDRDETSISIRKSATKLSGIFRTSMMLDIAAREAHCKLMNFMKNLNVSSNTNPSDVQ